MSTTPGLPTTRFLTWRRAALGVGVLSLSLAFMQPARPAVAAPQQAQATTQSGAAAAVARGEYLANNVAMCVQCHSPRDASGAIRMSEKFRGGAIPFKSPWADEWAYHAPSLAGLPGFTDDQLVTLLTQGRATGRTTPRSPMPSFRMSREDAAAIVAYLRSF